MLSTRSKLLGRSLALVTVLALLLIPAAGALAASDSTTTEHGTYTFQDVAPCGPTTGSLYDITADFNRVMHFSTDQNGGEHFTAVETASFVATPVSGVGTTYTGHYTNRFGDNSTQKTTNNTFTFTVVATGADGSTFHYNQVTHVSTSATGMTVQFDKPNCH